jgi:hypothetical protein
MLSQLLTLLVYLRSTVNRERQLDVWTQATNIMDAIVQSSGMNKSRLLDEFSNNFLRYRSICVLEGCLIFGYLRHACPLLGYPPSDNEVRHRWYHYQS